MRLGASAAWLGGCTLASQVLLLGTLPLIARAFGPEQFGIYTVFVGVLTIAGVFVGLRYESAAVIAATDRAAAGLIVVVLLSGAVMALLVVLLEVILRLGWPHLAAELDAGGLGTALALALVATGVQRSVIAWGTRRGSFRMLGLSQLAFNVLMVAGQLAGAVLVSSSAQVLAWGHAAALALSSAAAFAIAFAGRGRLLVSSFGRHRLLALGRRFRHFPAFMVLYGLMSTLRERSTQFLLGGVAGADVLGRFALAWRVTAAPNSLLYAALGPTFFSAAARGSREGNEELAVQLVRFSAVLLVPAFVFLAIEAPTLAAWVFGAEWGSSGRMMTLLAVPMLTLAATGWLDRLFDVYRQQAAALALETGFTVLVVATFGFALRVDPSGDASVGVFAALSVIYYHLYVWVAFRRAGMPTAGITRLAAIAWLGAAVYAVLAAWCAANLSFSARAFVWLSVQALACAAWLVRGGGWHALRSSLKEHR